MIRGTLLATFAMALCCSVALLAAPVAAGRPKSNTPFMPLAVPPPIVKKRTAERRVAAAAIAPAGCGAESEVVGELTRRVAAIGAEARSRRAVGVPGLPMRGPKMPGYTPTPPQEQRAPQNSDEDTPPDHPEHPHGGPPGQNKDGEDGKDGGAISGSVVCDPVEALAIETLHLIDTMCSPSVPPRGGSALTTPRGDAARKDVTMALRASAATSTSGCILTSSDCFCCLDNGTRLAVTGMIARAYCPLRQ